MVHVGYLWFALPWAGLLWYRSSFVPGVSLSNPGYPVKWKDVPLLGLWMSWLLVLVAYAWYLSLPRTEVGPNTTIYQSASVFVFLLSAVLLDEDISIRKGLSVALCVVGVAVMAMAKSSPSHDGVKVTVSGYLFLLVSVGCYALYEVVYKYVLEGEGGDGQEKAGDVSPSAGSVGIEAPLLEEGLAPQDGARVHSGDSLNAQATKQDAAALLVSQWNEWLLQIEFPMLVSTIIGLGTLLTMWPVFFALNAVESGPFSEPFVLPNRYQTTMLIVNGFLDSWYYMLLVYGIAITNPVFMSVGVMMVVPTSFVVDFFLHHTVLTVNGWIGVVLVATGFVLLQVTTPFRVLEQTTRVSILRKKWCGKPTDQGEP